VTDADKIANIKLRLNISLTDATKDALVESYLQEARERIINYCNISALPPELDFTEISITVDLYNIKGASGDRAAVKEKQGEREITYQTADTIGADAVVKNYAPQLNRFRRVKVV